jgi:hypothetical protein
MPTGYRWFRGGPGLSRAGRNALFAADDTQVWVWDEETGNPVTDLLDETATPISAPKVVDGWVLGAGLPNAVRVASFSLGKDGKRYPLEPANAAVIAQTAADAAASSAAAAQSSADSSAASAALVPSPAGDAMDAYMGGSASGLVTQVKARTRLVTPAGAGTSDTTALQNAINDAATNGAPLSVRGSFSINGSLTVPAKADVEFDRQALVTQTASLTPVFVLTNVSGVRLRNPRVQGLTTDYVNNSGVYQAAAVRLLGTTNDVQIEGGSFLGMAGAGVFMQGGVTDVQIRNVRMTGAGSTYILNTTYNYSGGVVTDTGASRWTVQGCEISGFAQGVVTGDNMTDVRILNNYVHDIPGQHGFYIETVNGCIVSGNVVRNAALLGMKLQVGTTTSNDVDAAVIADNVFYNVGAQGILLDNPPAGSPRFRRVNINGNIVRTSAGNGIEIRYGVGVHCADNAVYGSSAAGIRVASSSTVELVDNRTNSTAFEGIVLSGVTDAVVDGNRVVDPASANGTSTEFGLHVLGTSSDLTFRDNKVTDSLGNMRYGVYVEAGDLTTMDFLGNRTSGATDYGYRGQATNARSFRGNSFSGTTGSILTPPSNFTAVSSPTSDTSGTKASIDAIRAVLTANGLTP